METLNKPETTPAKRGFISSRMNKDNFWNLVFWIFVVIAVGIAESVARMISFTLVLPVTIPVFVLAVYFAAKLNPVTFENNVCTSKSGRSFKQNFFWKVHVLLSVVIFSIATIIFPFIILEGKILSKLVMTNLAGWILLIPILYSILKNIPVTVYFKRETWFVEGIHDSHSFNSRNNNHIPHSRHFTASSGTHSTSMSNPRNLYSNPSYRSYSGNIFNR